MYSTRLVGRFPFNMGVISGQFSKVEQRGVIQRLRQLAMYMYVNLVTRVVCLGSRRSIITNFMNCMVSTELNQYSLTT